MSETPQGWDELGDDELMALLGEAVAEADAPDEDAATVRRRREAARAALTWRTVDAELAELLHDSALDAGAAVRSAATAPRTLSFAGSGLTLEVEVDGEDLLVEVLDDDGVGAEDGAGASAGAGVSVTLQRPDGSEVVAGVDALGFARLPGEVRGTVRLVAVRGDARLTTPWTTL